ncbi:DUF3857 domain-containing protein [Cellulophaga lytica]|uniref:DUF3857 domain-containing protein n=1 Tax=Cellulophaga lytica TaxID=979 RepID=UPI000952B14D|nr:DUF3857 domain-containing protein [Cellulophaga lytica]
MRLFFSFILLLFVQLSEAQDFNYQSLLINSNLTKNANAVVRLDEMNIHISSKTKMNIKHKRIVTVLNKFGDVATHTYRGYDLDSKLISVQALVYNQLGKQIGKFKEKDFKDVSAVDGSTLYSDSRIKYLDYTPVTYPYTMEFTYEYTNSNTGELIPAWYFLDSFYLSTEESSISITYDDESFKPEIREANLEGLDVEKIIKSGSTSYTVKNIPALKKESLSPAFYKISPKLQIRPINFTYGGYDASIKTWQDLGKWMYTNLLKGRGELPESTINTVKSLTKEAKSDIEKAKIIYKYVQDNTRYISVQVGIGGMQPISALDVDRVKYGDCKGLSNYTMALLHAVGVKAFYTHVEAGNYKESFNKGFASLAAGNHVILAIESNDKYYWIDCTSQIHPFGFLGDFTDGRTVHVIKPDGGELVQTDSYVNKDNYQKTEAHISLSNTGVIAADVVITTKGVQYDDRFSIERKTSDDIKKHYTSYWSYINNLKINNYTLLNNRDSIVFTEKISLEATNYASVSGNRLLFMVNALNRNNAVPDRYRNRKLPLEIQRGYFDEDEFEILLPLGFEVEAMPNNTLVENEFGLYSVSYKLSEDLKNVVYKRKLLIKEGYYPKEKYKDYRDFRKKVSLTDNAKIVLVKK